MGHPFSRTSEERRSTFDRRPQTFAQGIVSGKLNAKRLCEYKKRSNEEFDGVALEFLFGNSLLQTREDNEPHEDQGFSHVTTARHPKKRRKEKQVVMFTDPVTGRQMRLLPRMSLW